LSGIQDTDSGSVNCICATDPDCRSPVILPEWIRTVYGAFDDYSEYHMIPGMVQGCYVIDTFLLSSLECYYLNSCLLILYNLLNATIIDYDIDLVWFHINPLVDDSSTSRFTPNTSLLVIVQEMMIEQWNPSSSFDHYYQVCAPIYCTHSHTARTITFTGTVIKLVSIIGGLTLVLRLITPQLCKFVFKILRPKTKEQRQGNYCLDN
jgi:hypothetical protein